MTDVVKENEVDQPPFRHVPYAPLDLDIDRRDDGTIVIKSRVPLVLREKTLPAYLDMHANSRPEYTWLAQRRAGGGDWRELSFGEGKQRVDALTQGLLDLNIPAGKSLVILSGNSIEHALMMMAAMQAHIPVAPISVAYSLMSADHAKLKEVLVKAQPGAVFVQDGGIFAKAIQAAGLSDGPVIAAANQQDGQISLESLYDLEPGQAVRDSIASIDPESMAKIMFTSGSTGSPKGVPLTHVGLVTIAESNCVTIGAIEPGSCKRLDWMPWSHVFGATTLSVSVVNGGTFYIDEGKPMPPLFGETVRNLAEVQPDLFMNVPAAIGMLVEALEKDEDLAARSLEKLTALGYGGASLPIDIVERFQKLAIRHTGHRITITCGYGTTETGPGGGFVYWLTDVTGTLGLPHPGYGMKLVPLDSDRYEVRISGQSVTRGYIDQPELNETIFDEEGFYKTGDCVTFRESGNPESGIMFAGRLNEEFKMQSGTFVRVGAVRTAVVDALAPLFKDAVICGENETELGILAWLNEDAARGLLGDKDMDLSQLSQSPIIIDEVKKRLATYNDANPGNASAVRRFRLLETLPSIDLGEVTDKGSINQRAVQRHRASEVAELFANPQSSGTIIA